jgi:FAD/FMN-containing dehydrogenase
MTLTTNDQIAEALANIVGGTHVSSAPADVDAYGGLCPFIVVWPAAPGEVARVLKLCREMGVAVGTAGFGSRAQRHWPLGDGRPRVALDTRRMTSIIELDEISLKVHCQTGIQVRQLEEALRRQGLTLGPFPVEIQSSTLGGLLSAPSATSHSPRVGWLVDACLGLSVALADGSLVQTRVAPRRATGPDLVRLFLGSRGGFGVITTAILRVHRRLEEELPIGFALPSFRDALETARETLAAGVRPARMVVLGPAEVREALGEGAGTVRAALLAVLGGPAVVVACERDLLDRAARQRSALTLTQSVVERWHERCLAAPSPERVALRQGARVLYSTLLEAEGPLLARIEEHACLRGRGVRYWAEALSLQGGTLWLSCAGGAAERAALRSVLLDGGMDPVRFDFPPLMVEIRNQLDPEGTMVIMEGEWSGT